MNPSDGTAPRSTGWSSAHGALAWSLAGIILLLTSTQLPFVNAAKFGRDNTGRMLSGVISLWAQGHGFLAMLVTFCGLAAPLALLSAIAVLAVRPGARRRPGLTRFIHQIEPWSMPDVRLLAVLVAFVKLSAVVEAAPAAGLWCYGAAAFCAVAAGHALPRGEPRAKPTVRRHPSGAAACGLGAVVLLVPAYTLPVMSFTRLGQEHADTLFASVLKLWHGGLWGIALIVFTASLLVPILKLLALGVLLAAERWPGWMDRGAQGRLHHVVHAVGRWSMLDVFLVAFLCGIVDFGSLAQIEARAGVLAFAGAVILTMFATSALDASHAPAAAPPSLP